ncbi:unnamed protein product [Lathyrus sativus]|nr:unnamed protein product [Lathyrus sativus]
MSNENGQKPPPSILVGRFKALLKQHEDDPRLRNSQPSTEEIIPIYELLLAELESNVKPITTDLTIIVEQHREQARGIAYAICARILEVSADHKLPSLHLLDNVVKNVGQEYVRYFSLRLPEVFCEAYREQLIINRQVLIPSKQSEDSKGNHSCKNWNAMNYTLQQLLHSDED